MALSRCPECNKRVSDKAGICPNCGYPINYYQTPNRIPSFVFVLFLFVLITGVVIFFKKEYGEGIVIIVISLTSLIECNKHNLKLFDSKTKKFLEYNKETDDNEVEDYEVEYGEEDLK